MSSAPYTHSHRQPDAQPVRACPAAVDPHLLGTAALDALQDHSLVGLADAQHGPALEDLPKAARPQHALDLDSGRRYLQAPVLQAGDRPARPAPGLCPLWECGGRAA